MDRASNLIRGVKVVGIDSVNSRRYTREALKAALPLYEGVKVRVNDFELDHPAKFEENQNQPRYGGIIGRLVNVRLKESGIWADLEYLDAHPFTRRLLEIAERMNGELLGLSHDAEGRGDEEDGVFVVREITEVNSVDIVDDPATTKSLFESQSKKQQKRRTRTKGGRIRFRTYLRRLSESTGVSRKLKRTLLREARKMREMEDDNPDEVALGDVELDEEDVMDVDAVQTGGDADEAIRSAIKTAMSAVIEDDSITPEDFNVKMKELRGLLDKLVGDPLMEEDEEEDVDLDDLDLDEEDDEDLDDLDDLDEEDEDEEELMECDDDDMDDMKESKKRRKRSRRGKLLRENKQLKRQLAVLKLCQAHDYQPSERIFESLCRQPASARIELLEELKRGRSNGRPRNTSGHNGYSEDDTPEAVARRLRGVRVS